MSAVWKRHSSHMQLEVIEWSLATHTVAKGAVETDMLVLCSQLLVTHIINTTYGSWNIGKHGTW